MTDVWDRVLTEVHHADVPPGLERRIRAELAPPAGARAPAPRRLQYAAGALGVLLLNHASGNLLFPAWIADAIHGHYDGHLYREAGVAVFGVGLLMMLAAFRTRLLDAATAVGVPVGLGFGAIGVWESSRSWFGAAVHLSEGAAAIVLLVLRWQFRYAKRPPHEDQA